MPSRSPVKARHKTRRPGTPRRTPGVPGAEPSAVPSLDPERDNSTPPADLSKLHCHHPRGWIRAECEHGSIIAIPMACGHCDACIRRRAARHAMRAAYGVEHGEKAAMLTLTSLPGTPWSKIMRAFQTLIRRFRSNSPALQYASFKEEGAEHGMRHLHVMLVGWDYVAQATISRLWKERTGASHVWIFRVDGRRAAFYAAKYTTKAMRSGLKCASYSTGWPKADTVQLWHAAGRYLNMPDSACIIGVSAGGVLILHHAPGCECCPDAQELTDDARLWIATCKETGKPPPT
jgi:hypothetical protein